MDIEASPTLPAVAHVPVLLPAAHVLSTAEFAIAAKEITFGGKLAVATSAKAARPARSRPMIDWRAARRADRVDTAEDVTTAPSVAAPTPVFVTETVR